MNRFSRPGSGWIEAVTGSMFSGKSEELIRRVRRAQIARQRVQIFKPKVDDRYATDHIVSHSDMKLPSQVVACSKEILQHLDDRTEVVGIDEGQFFPDLADQCEAWAASGKTVFVSALDGDFRRVMFDPVARLLPLADTVAKLRGVCMECRKARSLFSRRLEGGGTAQVLVGGSDAYHSVCRQCW